MVKMTDDHVDTRATTSEVTAVIALTTTNDASPGVILDGVACEQCPDASDPELLSSGAGSLAGVDKTGTDLSSSASSEASPSPAPPGGVTPGVKEGALETISAVENGVSETEAVTTTKTSWEEEGWNGDDVSKDAPDASVIVNGTADNMAEVTVDTTDTTECYAAPDTYEGRGRFVAPAVAYTAAGVQEMAVQQPAAVHVHNHPVCPANVVGGMHPCVPPPIGGVGAHSPHIHSPAGSHSSGSSPHDNGGGGVPQAGGMSGGSQQYVVNVHVNPGETFSVRVGDQVQLIQGM